MTAPVAADQLVVPRGNEIEVDSRSRGWLRVGERAYPAIIFAVAFVLFVARRPQVLLAPEFRGEDGQIFYVGTYFMSPLESLFAPNGYLYVGERAVALLARLVPVANAPLVTNLASLLVVAAIATFIATRLNAEPRIRVALAGLLLVLPGSVESHGQLAWLGWYLAPFLVGVALAHRPETRGGRLLEASTVLLAGLTTPLAVVLAPLFVVRRERLLLAAIGIAAAAQLVAGLVVPRAMATGTPGEFGALVLVRAIGEPFLGEVLFEIQSDLARLISAGAVACLAVLALRSAPRSWLLVAGYVWVASLATVALKSGDPLGRYIDGVTGNRYFLVPGLALAALVVAVAIRTRRPAAMVLSGLLALGIVADFEIPALPAYEWQARSACIGGAAPCVVPVYPPSVFSIDWPGAAGVYHPWGAKL